MMDVVVSQDDRFVAGYTNYDETILLNAITSEFVIIDNPLDNNQTIQGLLLHNYSLIIYGQYTWSIFTTTGQLVETLKGYEKEERPILSMLLPAASPAPDMVDVVQKSKFQKGIAQSLAWRSSSRGKDAISFFILRWSGDMEDNELRFEARNEASGFYLSCYGCIVLNEKRTMLWTCPDKESNDVSSFSLHHGKWIEKKQYAGNRFRLIQLSLSSDETYLIGTFTEGFQLWKMSEDETPLVTTLKLPPLVRNVSVKMNKSNRCLLSKNNVWAIAGVRKVGLI